MSQKKASVPRLRFPQYSSPWLTDKVKNIFEQITRGQILAVHKLPQVPTGEYIYPVYSSQTVNQGVVAYYKEYLFADAITWTTDGSKAGTVAYRAGKFFSTNVNGVLLSRQGRANRAMAAILSRQTHKYVSPVGNAKLMSHVMGEIELTYPPTLAEQEQISAFIALLEEQIAHYEQVYQLWQRLDLAVQQATTVRQGLAPALRFAGFSQAWQQARVKDLFKRITRGRILNSKLIQKQASEAYPYPVYSSQTLNQGILGYYKEYLFEDAITWTTDGANAGTVRFCSGKFFSTNVNGVLISSQGLANPAIASILNQVAYKYVSRVGNAKLMNKVMEQIIICYPPEQAEQNKLSRLYQDFTSLLRQLEEQIKLLQARKTALLEQMLVG